LGLAVRQGVLVDQVRSFCDRVVPEDSLYGLLRRDGDRLFPDGMFADLFSDRGRRSVPPSVVAVVMVLQRLEGLSDREAVDRYAFDVRWRWAAGVDGWDESWDRFAHTVLVDMRERLRRSEDRDRIFRVVLEAAKKAGLVGRRRVLDSTCLYDAVATMDTITLIRSAIRGLLAVADAGLEVELRAVLSSGDDYASNAKPQIAWDDIAARDELVDSRAKDGFACLDVLDGRRLDDPVGEAARLLAVVLAQDLDEGEDGVFRIARRVAKDRTISTVDSQTRHGHKTQARGFDGYKAHAAVDPDSEIITATKVTPGNVGDATVAQDLIADLIDDDAVGEQPAASHDADSDGTDGERAKVYGDAAYGTGPFQEFLDDNDIDSGCKTQPPSPRPGGLFSKDRFVIDLDDDTVTCPTGVTVTIGRKPDGSGIASFAGNCTDCPLQDQCTTSKTGRTINLNAHEETLARVRADQADPDWQDDYRATRPKVERKLAHLMRRRHGGRRARVRGTDRVDADFNLLAAAVNLARGAVVGLHWTTTGWATPTN